MRPLRTALVAVLLAGPGALAFFTGGYPERPRAWAGAVAWALAAAALLVTPGGLPRTLAARLAIGGIAGLAVWTALSAAWAPAAAEAYRAAQLPALYAGALVAAALLLRGRAGRLVEPALAAGTLMVVGYALAERLLPGLIELERSLSASGRLEQPLTYWNALGLVAALGVVLCARLGGDASRAPWLRAAAAAAAAPLGAGLYMTFSRGALFACAAGFIALLLAARSREQVRAAALILATAAVAAAATAPLDGVTSLAGELASRERQGLAALALLLAIAAVAALLGRRPLRVAPLVPPPNSVFAATCVVLAGLLLAISFGGEEHGSRPLGGGAERLVTFTSDRYAYWEVAANAFADAPLRGEGAGGWGVRWRQERRYREGVRDAHSLPLQTAAELGLVGLALLAAWLAGVALAARTAARASPGAAAGPIAGCVVWLAHSALDWDFQMPATTLPAVVLAGALLAQSASAMRGASRENTRTASTQTAA